MTTQRGFRIEKIIEISHREYLDNIKIMRPMQKPLKSMYVRIWKCRGLATSKKPLIYAWLEFEHGGLHWSLEAGPGFEPQAEILATTLGFESKGWVLNCDSSLKTKIWALN